MTTDEIAEARRAKDWNEAHPVGSRVRLRWTEEVLPTRQEAGVYRGVACVWLRGMEQAVPLSQVDPLPTDADLENAGQLGLLPDPAA